MKSGKKYRKLLKKIEVFSNQHFLHNIKQKAQIQLKLRKRTLNLRI